MYSATQAIWLRFTNGRAAADATNHRMTPGTLISYGIRDEG